MKVLQLIDSLRPGGAERMAVNLANSLLPHIDKSFLCCTRVEGELKKTLNPDVGFLFLNKKNSFDLKAFIKLKKFIKKNNIDIIHAHGTSFFFGGLLKLSGTRIKLVWHDHYGNRYSKKQFSFPLLLIFSFFFDGIITVNNDLLNWANKNLRSKNNLYLPNFVSSYRNKKIRTNIDQDYIICLANLKAPKNHLVLLKAFQLVLDEFPSLKLFLIGKTYKDDYQKELEDYINKHGLKNKINLMGEIIDNFSFLQQAKIGVLSSDSEGFPMTLLEYGMADIPVVCTDVGQCAEILNLFGKVVPPGNYRALAAAIILHLKFPDEAKNNGDLFYSHVNKNYSAEKVIPEFITYYNNL